VRNFACRCLISDFLWVFIWLKVVWKGLGIMWIFGWLKFGWKKLRVNVWTWIFCEFLDRSKFKWKKLHVGAWMLNFKIFLCEWHWIWNKKLVLNRKFDFWIVFASSFLLFFKIKTRVINYIFHSYTILWSDPITTKMDNTHLISAFCSLFCG
jgi:hypothetical protein